MESFIFVLWYVINNPQYGEFDYCKLTAKVVKVTDNQKLLKFLTLKPCQNFRMATHNLFTELSLVLS
jgi:hypothetical protein